MRKQQFIPNKNAMSKLAFVLAFIMIFNVFASILPAAAYAADANASVANEEESSEPILAYDITRLSIAGIEGDVDQEARTITFTVPEDEMTNHPDFGRQLRGSFTGFEAVSDPLIFYVAGQDWTVTLGNVAGVATGDTVRVEGGVPYTIIVEEILAANPEQITTFRIGRFEGVIDQDEATITLRIPRHLLNTTLFAGSLSFEAGDADELMFVRWGTEVPFREGNRVNVYSGVRVHVPGGVVYTLIIDPFEAYEGEITQLIVDGFEGIIDQTERTITFNVPRELLNDTLFAGILGFEAGDADELMFVRWETEVPFREGNRVNFYSGALVSIKNGIVYTLIIAFPPPTCPVIVEGQFYERINKNLGETYNYSHITDWSHWRICEDGTLEIDGGFVNWRRYLAPWEDVRVDPDVVGDNYSHHITDVVITGPIEAGSELRSLFSRLVNVTEINGLSYLDTSATTSMENMFRNSTSLIRLDLSVLDTSNVTDMHRMFTNARSLRELTLGEDFRFVDNTHVDDNGNIRGGNAGLPNLSHGTEYTGMWQNGEFIFTSAQLMSQFDGATMAGTFVWQVWEGYDVCEIIASGRFAHQAIADSGVAGSAWRLCEDGTLEIDEGFINWTLYNGPWHNYRNDITAIVITGPITAGPSLRSLFRDLNYVTEIVGLTYFDTELTTSMQYMFRTSVAIVALDLSSFDSTNVTNMHRMFTNMHALDYVDFGENFIPADNSGLPAHLRP